MLSAVRDRSVRGTDGGAIRERKQLLVTHTYMASKPSRQRLGCCGIAMSVDDDFAAEFDRHEGISKSHMKSYSSYPCVSSPCHTPFAVQICAPLWYRSKSVW